MLVCYLVFEVTAYCLLIMSGWWTEYRAIEAQQRLIELYNIYSGPFGNSVYIFRATETNVKLIKHWIELDWAGDWVGSGLVEHVDTSVVRKRLSGLWSRIGRRRMGSVWLRVKDFLVSGKWDGVWRVDDFVVSGKWDGAWRRLWLWFIYQISQQLLRLMVSYIIGWRKGEYLDTKVLLANA